MSIATSTAKVQYTLSTAVQALPIPFYFLENAHIKAIRARSGVADYVMVLGTDYTLTGAGDEAGGTLTTIATNMQVGDIITIKRDVSVTQQTNYVYNDKFPAEVHEKVADKLTMIAQQLKEVTDRAFQFPESEVAGTGNIMPAASGRAAKILGFDVTGNAVQLYDPISAVFAQGVSIYANSVAAMKAVSVTGLLNGQQCHVGGYATVGDGGGGTFVYAAASSVADNGGTIIAPTVGTGRWIRVFSGAVNALWFGAKGDGVMDDSASITLALAAATSSGGSVYFPAGSYLVSRQGTFTVLGYGAGTIPYVFRITSPLHIFGDGPSKTKFLVPMDTGNNANLFLFTATRECVVENLGAERSSATNGTGLYSGALVAINQCTNVVVSKCWTKNMRGLVTFFACTGCRARDCVAEKITGIYSGSHFGSYASSQCEFIDCTCYGGSNDGDFVHYAGGAHNAFINCKAYNYERDDATKAIAGTGFQGLMFDSGQRQGLFLGCTAYGYYYGFDIKTNCERITVDSCFAQKNKVGVAIRRGEGNSQTLHTIVRGCTIAPDGGNGNTTVVLDGFQLLGIWMQDAYGVLIEGNHIGKGYTDSVTPDSFLCIGGTWNDSGDQSTTQGVCIQNNRLVNQTNFAGKNRVNPSKFLYLAGSSSTVKSLTLLSILGNEFKNNFAGDVTTTFVDIRNALNVRFIGNGFGALTYGSTGSTGTAINLVDVSGATISGNSWQNHGQLLKATNCEKVVFHANLMRACVSGTSVAQIYLDNVRGFTMTANNYDFSGSGLNDGRPVESANTPATARYLIAGNLLSITNYGSTNWYRIDGVDAPYRADVLVRDNMINGARLTGALSATATLNFASIAAGASEDLTITLPGAVAGDSVDLGLPAAPAAGIVFNAFVSAADTVTVRATNITAGAIDPASATYRVTLSNR